jgi:hypothetical protein
MAVMKFTTRRTVFALVVAIATIAAPAVATFAGAPPTVAPRILAECTTSSEPGNTELDCEPSSVSDFSNTPSEMGLTEGNQGIESPENPQHGR